MPRIGINKIVLFTSLLCLCSCSFDRSDYEILDEISNEICTELNIEEYSLERDYASETEHNNQPKYIMNCGYVREDINVEIKAYLVNYNYHLVFDIVSTSEDESELDNLFSLWSKYVECPENVTSLSEFKKEEHIAFDLYDGEETAYEHYWGRSVLDEFYMRYSVTNEGKKLYLNSAIYKRKF